MASGDQQPERASAVPGTSESAQAGQPDPVSAEVAALREERHRLMAALAAQAEELKQRTQELAAARAELARLRGTADPNQPESMPGLSDNDWDRLVGDDDR